MNSKKIIESSIFAAVLCLTGCGHGGSAVEARDLAEIFGSRLFTPNYEVLALPAEKITGSVAVYPDKRAFYGDMHVHTAFSFDGYSMGTVATPRDAYRYATGEPLRHPAGFDMKLKQSLDFYAVTDHAMFLGLAMDADSAGSDYSKTDVATDFQGLNNFEKQKNTLLNVARRAKAFGDFLPKNVGAINSGELPKEVVKSVASRAWLATIEAARDFYKPGEFTTFVGYEYTSMASDAGNLHRNVIFKDAEHLPAEPFSTMHSENPEHLWDWMDILRSKGVDSLAIPHNSNGSNGHMFEMTKWDGSKMDIDYVQKRRRNEPLVEITQIKGTSETHPSLSPDDEWANFEIDDYRVASNAKSEPNGSYVRQAYQRGLELDRQELGNPYDFGVIGSSDTHNAASGVDEEDFVSKIGLLSSDAKRRGSVPFTMLEATAVGTFGKEFSEKVDGRTYISGAVPSFGASGLAGVWAESNTREAIYSAFQRKETFGTSGPRISIRFFAGKDYDDSLLVNVDAIARAYKGGVPMGGRLSLSEDEKPRFFIWAAFDPNSAPLQRVQVVKVWLGEDASQHEAVYDAACAGGVAVDPVSHRCPDNHAEVNLEDCSISDGTGASEIKTIWLDPTYEAGTKAIYYARVLENPTCRWSTWDAIRAGVEPRSDLQTIIQERAWSSAIHVSTQPLKPLAK